jgi:hypothetical protein
MLVVNPFPMEKWVRQLAMGYHALHAVANPLMHIHYSWCKCWLGKIMEHNRIQTITGWNNPVFGSMKFIHYSSAVLGIVTPLKNHHSRILLRRVRSPLSSMIYLANVDSTTNCRITGRSRMIKSPLIRHSNPFYYHQIYPVKSPWIVA